MKNIQDGFDFLINYSIWVAISIYCLTLITYYNLNLPANVYILLFTSFGAVIGYNFIKHYRPKKSNNFNTATILNIVSFLICVYSFLKLSLGTQVIIVIPFLITFFYAVPFGKKSLRYFSGLKIYSIAFCWVLVTSVLPIVELQLDFTTDIVLENIQRFLFVIVITLPFEIRDVLVDSKNLNTIPQQFGIKKTKLYGLFLLLIFFFMEFFKDDVPQQNLIILPLIFLCSLLFLVFASKKQTRYYASFYVEGIPVFWLLLWLSFIFF